MNRKPLRSLNPFIYPLAFLFIVLALTGCEEAGRGPWNEEAGYRWAEVSFGGSGAGFEEVAPSRTGIDFVNHLTEAQIVENRHLLDGSGVAVGDVDGDGYPDVYFARLDGDNRLYRNLGGWRFEDVTEQAGVAAPGRYASGAALADLDGDGDLDLLVTAMGGPNALYVNDGSGVFTETTAAAGLTSEGWGSTSMALADVDGDGDLDLYLANYKYRALRDSLPPDRLAWNEVVKREGDGYVVAPAFRDDYRIRVYDSTKVMRIEMAEPDVLYLNDGTGRFEALSYTSGAFLDEDGQPLTEAPRDWALAARFHDVNGDGTPDLYVANDFESPDHFWLGDGTGRFQRAPRVALRKTSNATMSVAFSDVDRDGITDFFLADMLSPLRGRRITQIPTNIPIPVAIGDIENRPQEMQNMLMLGRGDGTWAEVAYQAGVAASEWTWSSAFVDVDLDGYEDLLLTNGHAYDVMNADAAERETLRQRTIRTHEDYLRLILDYPPLALKNIAFRNRGDGTAAFDEVPDAWGLGRQPDVSHGLALADFDLDGDLDLALNRLNAPAGLFRNQADAPRLAVRLRGAAPNTHGIGARITVRADGLPAQTKEIAAGGQYLSSDEPLAVFAADAPGPLTVEVRWRSGRVSTLEAQPNRIYEIDEPTGALRSRPTPMAGAEGSAASGPDGGLFEAAPLSHRHAEAPYDDFARQPLLPRRLSQQGPAAAWADLDGDGLPELLLGSGGGGELALFRNQDGTLTAAASGVAAGTFDQAGVLAVPTAAGVRVLVAVSNYERGPRDAPEDSRVDVYAYGGGGLSLVERVALGPSSVGALSAGDLDGDGDLDVVAAGRHVPGGYPEGARTLVLEQTSSGVFVASESLSAGFAGAGLVTGVALGDVDGDGDQDVVLSEEWGPVRVYANEGGGRFTEETSSLGLSAYTGWWQGVSLGDFDEDGHLDVAATNWGLNSKYGGVSSLGEDGLRLGNGLRVYYGDFDRNGILDVVEAHYDEAVAGYVPWPRLSVLAQGVPYVRTQMRSHAQYAEAPVDDVFGARFEPEQYREASTLQHVVFMNRGDRFEPVALPPEAQRTAAFAPVVADYDGDGHDDLFLSQNFFALPTETARQDAGRGLLLRGDGRGGFTPMEGPAAGVMVYGEQRAAAAADYDGDARVDLLVTQNGAATTLWRNRGGAPGVVVRLRGAQGNAWGVGAQVRLAYASGAAGPWRVVEAGSGYWSQSSPVLVLGVRSGSAVEAVEVRWPDGTQQRVPVSGAGQTVDVAYGR